jgi:SAM-dependent methyltransferase
MVHPGFMGGELGYRLLRWLGGRAVAETRCNGGVYARQSKVESLFGPGIWSAVTGNVVLDFGCGLGFEVIEMAEHGALLAIGVDSQKKFLDLAARDAQRSGVSGRCLFTTRTVGKVDAIFSIDGFEHYGEPEQILKAMREAIRPGGRVFISFGPPWLHPRGGHLFSVFPWAHLIFTERALMRWRSDFKSDGATRFGEVEGGLNRMTVRRFEKLVAASDFEVETFEAVPIKRLRRFFTPLTREFLTSIVRCTLRPRPATEPT